MTKLDECLTCQPGDPTHHESAVENSGCKSLYLKVDECMLQHKGRVSACQEEWANFRKCHARQKNQR